MKISTFLLLYSFFFLFSCVKKKYEELPYSQWEIDGINYEAHRLSIENKQTHDVTRLGFAILKGSSIKESFGSVVFMSYMLRLNNGYFLSSDFKTNYGTLYINEYDIFLTFTKSQANLNNQNGQFVNSDIYKVFTGTLIEVFKDHKERTYFELKDAQAYHYTITNNGTHTLQDTVTINATIRTQVRY